MDSSAARSAGERHPLPSVFIILLHSFDNLRRPLGEDAPPFRGTAVLMRFAQRW